MRQFTRAAIAAAAIILVVFSGWSLVHEGFDSRAAIAQAIEQVRAVRAMSFVTTTQVPGQDMALTIRTIATDSGHMRQEIGKPVESVTLIDFNTGQMVTLVSEQKLAQVIDMSGLPKDSMPGDIIKQFSQLDPDHTTYLRDEPCNSVATHVYKVDHGPLSGLIWIDSDTKLPVRMEMTMSAGIKGRAGQKVVMGQFDWDVQVDESAFAMQIPEGYQVRKIDMSHPTEADWVLLLRLWAALTQEPFPDQMGPANLSAIGQLMYDPALSAQENHRRLVEHVGPLLGKDAFSSEHSEQSLLMLSQALGRGAMFVTKLEQTEWRWVGGGVSAGEADKPLCWWKDPDTGKYRMVYGDFTVRDVQQSDLPDMP